MHKIETIKTEQGLFFGVYVEEEQLTVVFKTLEDAIIASAEPVGILTDDGLISKGDEIITKAEEIKPIDPKIVEKISKTILEKEE